METQSIGALWEELGNLDELETAQVLTRLYTVYETQLENNPDDVEAQNFFIHLRSALSQASDCNLNRR